MIVGTGNEIVRAKIDDATMRGAAAAAAAAATGAATHATTIEIAAAEVGAATRATTIVTDVAMMSGAAAVAAARRESAMVGAATTIETGAARRVIDASHARLQASGASGMADVVATRAMKRRSESKRRWTARCALSFSSSATIVRASYHLPQLRQAEQ